MTPLAWAAPFLALAICAAWAWRGEISTAALRARWAWRCRGCPPPASEADPLSRDDMRAFIAAVRAWRQPAAPEPERSRT